MSAARHRARLAILTPYWSFFEASVEHDLRADRVALAATVADVVAAAGDVVASEVAEDVEGGRAAGERITAAGPDAVIVVSSMAVPPAHALAALDVVGADVPLVVCAARRRDGLSPGFSHGDITTDGATVGTPQLTSVLHRRGRAHDLVLWRPGDAACDARLRRAAAAAAAAARLRRARILRVGRPIPGYDCVDVDDAALARATGIRLVPVDPARVAGAARAVPAGAAEAIAAEVRAGWELGPGVEDGGTLAGSVRVAAGLAALDAELEADAGAMNCHVAELRHGDDPGLAPCFALGRETSRGVPWTCSGDVLTAVAMLAAKLLGGPALYHEIEALDHARGEALLANTGEHDLGLLDEDRKPALVRNRWFDGLDAVCGACASFAPPAGPASLVGFVPHAAEPSGFRFVVAEGEFTGRAFPQTGTPNAGFRFAGPAPVEDAWVAWARAGVNHHSAATTGHRAAEMRAVAAHLGVGCVVTSDAQYMS